MWKIIERVVKVDWNLYPYRYRGAFEGVSMSLRNPSWSYPDKRFFNQPRKEETSENMLPSMGGGRSYGDANFLGMAQESRRNFSEIIFDEKNNLVKIGGGVTIREALNYLISYNRTLPVIPGTMHATIGGCIASDIHGKNSHHFGSFCQNLIEFKLNTPDGETVAVHKGEKLWQFTVGGQGLTGNIESAVLSTVEIKSNLLSSKVVPTRNFDDLFKKMDSESKKNDFAVGWVDGLTPFLKERGYIEFCNEIIEKETTINPPKENHLYSQKYPKIRLVNSLTIILFNILHHLTSQIRGKKYKIINRWDYFFPMAKMGNWNYFFGSNGYHEVQFNCEDDSLDSAIRLLRRIMDEQKIFLIGIKIMKGQKSGLLSFPTQKWSIAIDFPATPLTPASISTYYNEILGFNGIVNLTKDWVLTHEHFNLMFPEMNDFKLWRESQAKKVVSNFSNRVGL